jgi:hypothetical protein
MSSSGDTIRISAFLDRQRTLLQAERQAEVEQSSLLLSSCPPKLLEKKGLALLGLGVVNVGLGLGGKRYRLQSLSYMSEPDAPSTIVWWNLNVQPRTTHPHSSLPILCGVSFLEHRRHLLLS